MSGKNFYILCSAGAIALVVMAVLLWQNLRQPALVPVTVAADAAGVAAAEKPAAVAAAAETAEAKATSKAEPAENNTSSVTQLIPAAKTLSVAFASQAPLANWDALHEETCEEAAMIMAVKYFTQSALSAQIMEDELQALVQWEADHDYGQDLTAAETAKILADKFGVSAQAVTEVTAERIKYEISQGHLVLVPTAGRMLDNPNFKTPGPIYHMLVIKGYDGKRFITNDPGTRKGNGFTYLYDNVLSAVHNWTPELVGADGKMSDANMIRGEKVMIIVSK